MDYGAILQAFLIVLIKVLLPIALTALVAFIGQKWKEARTGTYAKEIDTAVGLIAELVQAAEQIGLTDALKAAGEQKKEYVMNLATEELKRRNITLDLRVIDALVEAAVLKAFGKSDVGTPTNSGS